MHLPAPFAPSADPALAALGAATAGTIVAARLSRPVAERGSRWRLWALLGGIALLAVAFVSPLSTLAAHYLLTAHLVQVTIVMGFAPPLLLLGLPSIRQPSAPRWALAAGSFVTHPIVALVTVNSVFFAWHVAGPYDAALRSPLVYDLQQATLLLASLAFWWPIVRPRPGSPGMSPLLKLGYILLATIPQTFAGLTVAMTSQPIYPTYVAAPRVLGMSAMADQQVAGAGMAVISKLALFAAFSIIFWRMLGSGSAADDDDGGRRRPRPDTPAPVPSPAPTPAWWRLLEGGPVAPEPPAPGRSLRSPAGPASSRR